MYRLAIACVSITVLTLGLCEQLKFYSTLDAVLLSLLSGYVRPCLASSGEESLGSLSFQCLCPLRQGAPIRRAVGVCLLWMRFPCLLCCHALLLSTFDPIVYIDYSLCLSCCILF